MMSRTGDDVAAEIMIVGVPALGSVLIVEGPTDEMFFSSRVKKNCYIAIGSGKRTVVRALEILHQNNFLAGKPIVGVVDEDYDWATGEYSGVPSLIKTDPRDLEGILFRSRAVQSVLAEYVDRDLVRALEDAEGKSIVDLVLTQAEFFGRIRMVSALGPKINLSKWRPVKYCRLGWTYDVAKIKDDAVGMGVAPTIAELEKQMAALSFPSIWHVVRGHDLVDIFCGLLIHRLGVSNVRQPAVEAIMRQAMPAPEFDACVVGQQLRAWESSNVALLS